MAGRCSTSPATEEDLLHIGSHMVKRWLGEISPHHVKVKIFEEKKHLLFLKIILQGAWRKEGAHSYQHLIQRRNSHSLVTISLFSLSGDLYLLSNPNNCFLYPVWPWSPRKLVWANWWHLSFFFSVCLSLRSFSAFFVTYIFSIILMKCFFSPSWPWPPRGLVWAKAGRLSWWPSRGVLPSQLRWI